MDGGGGYGANNSQWQPGMSPRGPPPPRHNSPMQYYTSGSRHGGYGASPRFSSSTPRPNRYQNQGHYGSPSGAYPHSNQFNSPYAGGDRPLEYTPSPVRPRHNSSHHHQPNFGSPNTYGRGGGFSSFRGGRGGRGGFRDGDRAPVEMYFKEDMLRDPWQGLKPYLMEKTSYTTT